MLSVGYYYTHTIVLGIEIVINYETQLHRCIVVLTRFVPRLLPSFLSHTVQYM